jgi:hypothetical protein
MPLIALAGLVLAIIIDDFVLHSDSVFWWTAVPAFALIVVSSFKVGSGDAVQVAKREAKRTGGVRVNSYPRIARAMWVIGAVLFCALIANLLFVEYPSRDERTFWQHLLLSPAMPGLSCGLWALGWYRPWDLKVVERETHASEVTT